MDPIALTAALASATGFALSTSLQHHAAGGAPESATGAVDFLKHLLSRPTWVIGQVLALLSFFLHALALHFGAIALVQPVVVSGIVIAVPMRAAMSRRLPRRDELVAVVVTTIGLAVFLVAANPSEGPLARPTWRAFLICAGFALVALLVDLLGSRVTDPRRRAGLLGVTAGILFGVVAGLVKLVIDTASERGLDGLLLSWPLWLLLLCGAGGIISNQRAYRIASLSASLPVLNIVDVVVALLVGILVFEEYPAHTPLAIAFQLAALGCVTVGLRALARVEEEDDLHPVPTV